MSGLEIVLIVGAGILIAKKLDDRKKRKLGQQPVSTREFIGNRRGNSSASPQATTVSRTESQAGSRIRRANQQVPVEEEEALPLYSPPSKESSDGSYGHGDEKLYLPTYDEARSETTERTPMDESPNARDATNNSGTNPFTDDAAQTSLDNITPTNAVASKPVPTTKSQKSSLTLKFWKREGAKAS